MLYWWIPKDRAWLSVRNVTEVDGRRIPDSKTRLERSFERDSSSDGRSGDADVLALSSDSVVARSDRLRALQEEARRFDLKPDRTIGNPTLVLQFLLPENRAHFTFTHDRLEKIGGASALKFNFVEHSGSTVIEIDNVPITSAGSIWIDERNGSVLKTLLTARVPSLSKESARHPDVQLTVDFHQDSRLALMVPSHMEESTGDLYCRSTYTNCRRFDTSGRVVSPK